MLQFSWLQIALIEDNPGDEFWFKRILQQVRPDATITVYETGIQALELFKETPAPDLIVMDWFLPILQPGAFISTLRAIPTYELVPLAICTGTPERAKPTALDMGVVACLSKPVDAGQLTALFEKLALPAN